MVLEAGDGGAINANGNNASTANVGSGGGGGGQGGSNVGGTGSLGVVILRLPTADNTAECDGINWIPNNFTIWIRYNLQMDWCWFNNFRILIWQKLF